MSEKSEITFMQVRLLRLASEEWNMSIQKVNELFDQYSILKFIDDCYGVFHMEGDYAVFDEIKTLLKNKGGGWMYMLQCLSFEGSERVYRSFTI